jgi:hypothetical protein
MPAIVGKAPSAGKSESSDFAELWLGGTTFASGIL